MMHRPWSSIVEVPYCFSRSNVKFQGHTALKIVKFYRNWAFLDSNSSLNSLMVMKCCTKLETAKERCPIVFQSHPSNFKVTRDKTSPLLTRIGRFRTIGRSQLSNPSDLPCYEWKVMYFDWNFNKVCSYESNYANPVYGVATIFHQVCCLHWGHPSLFHTDTALSIWYEIFYMRDISYRLIWMKFINMLSVYGQSGAHRPFNWLIIAVLT